MQSTDAAPIWSRTVNGVSFSDIPVRSNGAMPDFCIIGSAKSGTSALSAMLAAQPFIHMIPIKEPNYFSTEVMLARGDDWYRGLYAGATKGQLLGEASTSYTRYPAVEGTAERMAAANPNMKLIYVIRNPVARAESDCLQILKYAKYVLNEDFTKMPLDTFFRMIEQPNHSYYSAIASTSMYIDQIEQFRKHFCMENIIILFQSDIKINSKQVLIKICNLLNVDPTMLVDFDIQSNVTSEFHDGLSRIQAVAKFQKIPFYRSLKSTVPSWMKSYLLRINSPKVKLRFSDDLRNELTEKFREPNRRLASLLGTLPADWQQ